MLKYVSYFMENVYVSYFMNNLLPWGFPVGRIAKLAIAGANVTNSSNPVLVAKNVSLAVVNCCAPPKVRVAAKCLALTSLIASTPVSPSTATLGAIIHIIYLTRNN